MSSEYVGKVCRYQVSGVEVVQVSHAKVKAPSRAYLQLGGGSTRMCGELLLNSSIVPFIDRQNGHSGVFDSSTRALANEKEGSAWGWRE